MPLRALSRWALPLISLTILAGASPSTATPSSTNVAKVRHSASEPTGPAPATLSHRKPFSKMSLSELEKHQEKALARYLYVSRYYLRWRRQNITSKRRQMANVEIVEAEHVRCKALGIATPPNYCWYASAAKWTASQLEKTQAKLQAIRLEHADWVTVAVPFADRAWPGTASWLLDCSSSEGGHGGWVMNKQGSGAGGWMQFMSGTFYSNAPRAFAEAASKGVVVPHSALKWSSTVGQAVTAAYMLVHGQRGQWTGANC